MSNKTVEVELKELIPQFYANDKEQKRYASAAEKEKAKIKKLMLGANIRDFNVDNIVAACTTSTREKMNEDALIPYLKKKKIKGIIKKKEYVDMEVLESAIFNGNIIASEISGFVGKTDVVTLRVTVREEVK